MTRKLLYTFLSLLFVVGIEAKDIISFSGKIIDKKTKEPMPFVNMGVLGTYLGAATNIDGLYELKIPSKYKGREIQISSVGYKTIKMAIDSIANNSEVNFEMESTIFNIDEVEVTAKSRLQYTRVKKAIVNIKDNYLQMPYNYDMYYREELLRNEKVERLRESAVRLYDDKGYERGNAFQVFKERGYEFLEVRKNFENETLADGSTHLDELLEMDIVRVRGNVLNLDKIDEYELNLEGETEFEGDKVWIIAYRHPNPSLATTGDYYVSKYSGKLYIIQKNYAIVRNVSEIVATNYSPQGRSFYVAEKRQKQRPKSIAYTATTNYKSHLGYYYLSNISLERKHIWADKISGDEIKEQLNAELLVTEVNTFNPKPIERRAYYENKPYDAKFWEHYNIIRDRQ